MFTEEVMKNCPRIVLQTRSGELVTKFVSPAAAAMSPLPEMVAWGNRAFTFHKEEGKELIYREGLLWYLVPGMTAQEVEE